MGWGAGKGKAQQGRGWDSLVKAANDSQIEWKKI